MTHNPLLAHFKTMQGIALRYILPEPDYESLLGHHSSAAAPGLEPAQRHWLFGQDMLMCLDGPAQRAVQAHAEFDYLAESGRTVSPGFNGELVPLAVLKSLLANFIMAAQDLDRVKKLLFYGEAPEKGRERYPEDGDGNSMLAIMRMRSTSEEALPTPQHAADLIHGILGVATEAGELAEILLASAFGGKSLDTVNLAEESGDVKWYLAIFARLVGASWDHDERINIEKLRARFPERFTEDGANNRDLERERNILSGGPSAVK